MIDSFFTIAKKAIAQFKDRNSRFIGLVFPVTSEKEIKDIQAALRKEYFDARHHCYAYILGYDKAIQKSNDDGEPSGSAGKPMLNQLFSAGVTNTLAVVIRYFGGTKLGVPGLINAYKTATKMAIEEAGVIEKHCALHCILKFSYPEINTVMQIIQNDFVKTISQQFDNQCEIEMKVKTVATETIISKLEKAGISVQTSSEIQVF